MINTAIPKFTMRFATKDDVAQILSFIKELAEYEKLAHEVVATEETLAKTLFGERKVAEVIMGFYDAEPVGFMLFFHNYSTFLAKPGIYLEDLYVKPQMRGKGIGKTMLSYLAKVAKERDCGRLEWWVLNWNKPAIDFYKSLEAQAMDEWTVFRLTDKTLNNLADSFNSNGY